MVNDYTADHPGKHGLPSGHRPLTRFLVVPILDEGHPRLLVAVSDKAEDYDEADIGRLSLLGEGVLAHMVWPRIMLNPWNPEAALWDHVEGSESSTI